MWIILLVVCALLIVFYVKLPKENLCNVDTSALDECKKSAAWYQTQFQNYLDQQKIQNAALADYNVAYTRWKTQYDEQLDLRNAGRKSTVDQVWHNGNLWDCRTLIKGPVFAVDSPEIPMVKLASHGQPFYAPKALGYNLVFGNEVKYAKKVVAPTTVSPANDFIKYTCGSGIVGTDPLGGVDNALKSCYVEMTQEAIDKYYTGKQTTIPMINQSTPKLNKVADLGTTYTNNGTSNVNIYYGTLIGKTSTGATQYTYAGPRQVKPKEIIKCGPGIFGTDFPGATTKACYA